ncbi:MAG TPA: hypothetical protein EYN91_23170 [Candidatus Melainabacteria bacterium]|nr:hypothetical protein [Candidatus Melainabacteria bacterium]HIN63423.1 hypothetical protein [Candidatus Obscuribacterales bacterium]
MPTDCNTNTGQNQNAGKANTSDLEQLIEATVFKADAAEKQGGTKLSKQQCRYVDAEGQIFPG